jgi:hypothetical protein
MVLTGDTTLVPLKATLPIAGFIVTLVQPETFQLSVEDPPGLILPGLASKEFTTGWLTPLGTTITVAKTCFDHSPLSSWTLNQMV